MLGAAEPGAEDLVAAGPPSEVGAEDDVCMTSDAVAEQSTRWRDRPCCRSNACMIATVGSTCASYCRRASNSSNTMVRRPDIFSLPPLSPGLPMTSSAILPGVCRQKYNGDGVERVSERRKNGEDFIQQVSKSSGGRKEQT